MISLIGGIDTRVFVFANLSLVNWQTFIISHRLFPAEVLNQLYDPQTRLSRYFQSHWGIDTRVFVNIETLSIRTVSGNLTTFRQVCNLTTFWPIRTNVT